MMVWQTNYGDKEIRGRWSCPKEIKQICQESEMQRKKICHDLDSEEKGQRTPVRKVN